MPAKSEKQRRAACAELGRRRAGKKGGRGRAFGTANTTDVQHFCKGTKRKKGRKR